MEFFLSLVIVSLEQVWLTLLHNWPYLAASVAIAVLLKLYVNAEQVSAFLTRYRGAGVVAATVAAVTTPLCSCGTTAVILGMMASRLPWAPVVAFMTASPLSSPEGLVYSAGLFGWPFALAFYLASIVLGLVAGWTAAVIESRGWLANQTRFAEPAPAACANSGPAVNPAPGHVFSLDMPGILNNLEPVASCGCDQTLPTLAWAGSGSGCAGGTAGPAQSSSPVVAARPAVTPALLLQELCASGQHLLVLFTGFAFIGYFLNGLIPANWVAAVFGSGNIYSVPLAATLGLPLYINSEASLPLIRALMDNGMSQGAALAFLISGAGTSIGAITGALAIARWRVIALVAAVLWGGAILCGVAFNLALLLKLW